MANPPRDPELPCVTEVLKDGQWSSQPAFVIGGGPSLKGFDPERLRGKGHVLCTNVRWRWPTCEVAYIKEQRLHDRERANHKSFGAADGPICLLNGWARHVVWPDPARPRIFYVPKYLAPGRWGTSLAGGVVNSRNTGMELVNLADILGCTPIFLIAFDMNCPSSGYLSPDGNYQQDWLPKCWGDLFKKWTDYWLLIKDQIRGEVVNLNPSSSLDIFPKRPLEEVVP